MTASGQETAVRPAELNDRLALVTGAAGFIGRTLSARLLEQGVRVRALLRQPCEGPWNETALCDLAASEVSRECMEGVDVIFHFAAKVHDDRGLTDNQEDYDRVNVEGTRKLIAAAELSGVRKFIFCSSVKASGEGSHRATTEDDPCVPRTAYGKSKLRAERLVLAARGIPHVAVIRPAMVYGPGSPGNLGRLIAAVRAGVLPPLTGLQNRRSMVHVDDVVSAAMLVAGRGEANRQIFHVTDGNYYSTSEIIDLIREIYGRRRQTWGTPIALIKALGFAGDIVDFVTRRRWPFDSSGIEKLIGSSAYDSSKIAAMLDFQPRWDLERGLRQIVEKESARLD